jgi:hypothetical protein
MLNKSIIQIGFKLISAFLLIGGLLAQGNVSGTVTDETGNPLVKTIILNKIKMEDSSSEEK